MSLIVDGHRRFLADEPRLAALRAAIDQAVRPGSVVVDLASGTGVLGLMACRAGAARVYAIEVGGMIEVARAAAAANGCTDRITFIQGLSSDVSLPERADVIVCDQIGRFGFDAGLLVYGRDARDRFLKPGGVMIPSRVDLWVALVESTPLRRQIDFWSGHPAGFDFSPAREWAVNTGYPAALAPDSLASAPARIASIDVLSTDGGAFRGSVRLTARRAATIDGLGGWFVAALAGGASMTNSPFAADRIDRRNVFFPIDAPLRVEAGDAIGVAIHVIPSDSIVTWTVGPARGSTLVGMLTSRDELRRMDPRSVPTLTPKGAARRSVLELCDGRRTLDDIEREVLARHPDLFRNSAEAAAFVAEVTTHYTK